MQYRIDKSIELLLSTNRNISDIAVAVGFSSQSYYTACFKKQKSVTPGQFRKIRRTAEKINHI
ncbi:helix-turn-helix domain-containing protein [Megasphaera sueciensis]|uniref:helix-turn-helix domain-containing protein n=1 Tax=Megasphaera sueciensis TaxID=349094 RepID=UPI003D01B208